LEQLCSKIVDCPHSTPQYTSSATGFYCVRSSDIQNGVFDFSDTFQMTDEEFNKRIKRHIPSERDVVYTREGARLGNAAQVPSNINICLGQRMMLFIADSNCATNEYIWATLNSQSIKHQVNQLIAGAAAPRINISDIRQFKVLLAPKELQQEFSKHVQQIRTIRDKQEELIAQAECLFNSLVQRAFKGEL